MACTSRIVHMVIYTYIHISSFRRAVHRHKAASTSQARKHHIRGDIHIHTHCFVSKSGEQTQQRKHHTHETRRAHTKLCTHTHTNIRTHAHSTHPGPAHNRQRAEKVIDSKHEARSPYRYRRGEDVAKGKVYAEHEND